MINVKDALMLGECYISLTLEDGILDYTFPKCRDGAPSLDFVGFCNSEEMYAATTYVIDRVGHSWGLDRKCPRDIKVIFPYIKIFSILKNAGSETTIEDILDVYLNIY